MVCRCGRRVIPYSVVTVIPKPRYALPLTLDEQVELLGTLLSSNVRIKRLEALIEELNRQAQILILELEIEKKVKSKT